MYTRLRELRKKQGLTQAQVGEILCVPQRTYSSYETGRIRIPPPILIALAIFYHTSIDYLLGLNDGPTPYPCARRRP